MEFGKFGPFNLPDETSSDTSHSADASEVFSQMFLRKCCPDPSRSAVQLPAECSRIPEQVKLIRPTDDPFYLPE